MSRTFFERPTIKTAGIAAFCLFVGLALGNGWATSEALDGQHRWLSDRCGVTIKKKVEQTHQQHIAADRETFGFSPEDLAAEKKR